MNHTTFILFFNKINLNPKALGTLSARMRLLSRIRLHSSAAVLNSSCLLSSPSSVAPQNELSIPMETPFALFVCGLVKSKMFSPLTWFHLFTQKIKSIDAEHPGTNRDNRAIVILCDNSFSTVRPCLLSNIFMLRQVLLFSRIK